MIKEFTIAVILFTLLNTLSAQNRKTDANIIGHVTSEGAHIPFATVSVKGTTIGVATDETGHYQLINLPTGSHEVVVSVIGYKTKTETITIKQGETIEIKFDLEPDLLKLDEVVVSADRGSQKRTEAPVIVNTISPELFQTSQSVSIGEGLNFSPGLRLENNCQNCGFSQVRMNGLEGPHSQILLNSRPVFSGLAGVYGLELIPTSIIEKVEVVRGGGSVLFGSNAIAGTINIILKEPLANTYEVGALYNAIGVGVDGSAGHANDYSVNANASVVSDDYKTGVTLYGFAREREMFDANDDSFSEIAPISNLTFGTRFYHKFSSRDKISLDFFALKEERDGGNMQDYPLHQREIAEAVKHNMYVGGLTYERYFRKYDLLTIYGTGQFLNRDSYYGAEYSMTDYGNSKDRTYNIGAHYKAVFDNSSLIFGAENTSGFLVDKKLGAPIFGTDAEGEVIITDNEPHTLIADQSLNTTGGFAQYDVAYNKFKFALGGRYDYWEIKDYAHEGVEPKSGNVFSPRVSLMYEIFPEFKARLNYSKGYRAPQIFDEDLHIESSGSQQVTHRNDPNLTEETSHSYMASLDYNGLLGNLYTGFLVEGFRTRLLDAFVTEREPGENPNEVVSVRTNAEGGATVQGVNMELRLKPLKKFEFTSGYTIQTSLYDNNEGDFEMREFERAPEQYGFIALDYDFIKNLCFSVTGNYTGSMLVPYWGSEAEIDDEGEIIGELRTSDSFFDMGVRLTYDVKLNGGATLQFLGGIKNMLNSYQSDFDTGINRDPAYIYGPFMPRSVYFGVKIGNFL